MSDKRTQTALDHYHACYRNETYQAFRAALTTDFHLRNGFTESDAIGWMNWLTDAALSVSGHPYYADSAQRFAVELGQADASIETIRAAITHLRSFEQTGQQLVDDVEVTALLVKVLERAPHHLPTAIESATVGHLPQHRAAVHLLLAADFLIRTAHIVLSRHVPTYAAEKARRARDNMAWGLQALVEVDRDYADAFRAIAESIITGTARDA